jgi:hypothetical protein
MTPLKIQTQEADAIVNAGRYLGFKNTGKRIQHRLRHAIRLLVRDARDVTLAEGNLFARIDR